MAFAVALGGAVMTVMDFRAHRSRFWLSGGINIFSFDRATSPRLFWASTVINTILIALLMIVSLAAMVLPDSGA